MGRITAIVPGHGYWDATPYALDAAIARYLPASAKKLRELCEERAQCNYSDIHDVSTFLVMLADWDGGE